MSWPVLLTSWYGDFSAGYEGSCADRTGNYGRRQGEDVVLSSGLRQWTRRRKRTILIAASILVAREWAQLDDKTSLALDAAIANAISLAEKIMQKIDNRSTPPAQSMTSSANYPWKGRTYNCALEFAAEDQNAWFRHRPRQTISALP